MDKSQAMKVMAESHRETVEELEDRIYAISESYRQEREYNDELAEQNKRYRRAIKEALSELLEKEKRCITAKIDAQNILLKALEFEQINRDSPDSAWLE